MRCDLFHHTCCIQKKDEHSLDIFISYPEKAKNIRFRLLPEPRSHRNFLVYFAVLVDFAFQFSFSNRVHRFRVRFLISFNSSL